MGVARSGAYYLVEASRAGNAFIPAETRLRVCADASGRSLDIDVTHPTSGPSPFADPGSINYPSARITDPDQAKVLASALDRAAQILAREQVA